jgi:Tfp pilus assembly protein FimT
MKNFYKNKKACPKTERGISALEILVVLAILGIIFAIVIPQFSKGREQAVLKSAVADTLSSIDKARAETLGSLDSSSYGVHFELDKVIIFKGTVYSPGDSHNEIVDIVAPATISNVTLNGISGTSGEFYFNRLSGVPSKTGTLTLSSVSYSKIITVSATGAASVN